MLRVLMILTCLPIVMSEHRFCRYAAKGNGERTIKKGALEWAYFKLMLFVFPGVVGTPALLYLCGIPTARAAAKSAYQRRRRCDDTHAGEKNVFLISNKHFYVTSCTRGYNKNSS
jgi:hypothetical protein